MMMNEMPIIPIYTYTSKHLVHPSVEGIYPNLMDSLNLKYVKLQPVAVSMGRQTKVLRFIFWRLLQAIPVIFVVITATFFWCAPHLAVHSTVRKRYSPR